MNFYWYDVRLLLTIMHRLGTVGIGRLFIGSLVLLVELVMMICGTVSGGNRELLCSGSAVTRTGSTVMMA